MKKLFIILFLILHVITFAWQTNTTATDYFFSGAKDYCNNKTDNALATVEEGLSKFPKDKKLNELYEKLKKKKEEKQKKEEEQKKKEQQQKQQQDKQQQQKQNGNQQQNQQGQQQQNQQDKQSQQKQGQQQQGQLTNEEAQKLLDAMAAEEGKVQQKLSKQKGKAGSKKVLKDW